MAVDLQFVEETVQRLGRDPQVVIPILQSLQEHYRYLPEEALRRVCDLTDITPAAITGVSTFYDHFRHRPVGEHLIRVCHGTACHVKGVQLVQDALAQTLGIADGEDTDPEGKYTIQRVACLGCCTLAPVVQIDHGTYGRLTARGVPGVLRAARHARPQAPAESPFGGLSNGGGGEIRVGLGSCCVAQGSGQVYDAVGSVLQSTGAAATLKRVGCVGMCHQTPLVELVEADGAAHFYAHVQPDAVRRIVLNHFRPTGIGRRLLSAASQWMDRFHTDDDEDASIAPQSIDVRDAPVCSFLGPQQRLATEYCGHLDPLDLQEYRRHNGFAALQHSLAHMTPEEIIQQIRTSGLRGRGGAGFPTHIKWDLISQADGPKYIICNGDEGDPGAFMDRMLLESFPYRVIEGMAIAARATGVHEGYFYIRAEYPLAVKRIRQAIEACQSEGILGDSVFGSDFALRLSVQEGAGAFICGEETALIHSLEGGRGTPRLRPPFPVEEGLHGRPTLINNVETFSLVPWIIRHGGGAFGAIGTTESKGTKVFALAGKIRRGGLIEVPMGVTLREIVEEIGGGVPPGRSFKAVQVGGPSGGCIPERLADIPVDYEAFQDVGAIMGSGGLVVMDDSDCMVDIARYFLRFTQEQSCGKCTFCRVGTKRLLEVLDRICLGKGRGGDLQQLEQLSSMVGVGSLCGLGRTAPNPVLSTLNYFREEYEAHLDGRCPAGRCQALINYDISDACIGCTLCAQHCPVDAIPWTPYRKHQIDSDRCTRCDTCRQVCPEGAVAVS